MMNNGDKNYISVGSWMWMLFVCGIPVIGFVMMLIWAFTGENVTRKNYFRAILAWMLIAIALVIALLMVGAIPELVKQIQSLPRE